MAVFFALSAGVGCVLQLGDRDTGESITVRAPTPLPPPTRPLWRACVAEGVSRR